MSYSSLFNDSIMTQLNLKVESLFFVFSQKLPSDPLQAAAQKQMGEFFTQSFSSLEAFSEKHSDLLSYLDKNNWLIIKEKESAQNIINALELHIESEKPVFSINNNLTQENEVLLEKKEKIKAFFETHSEKALVLDSALYFLKTLQEKIFKSQSELKKRDMSQYLFIKNDIVTQLFKIENIFNRLEKMYVQKTQEINAREKELDTQIAENETKSLLNQLASPII